MGNTNLGALDLGSMGLTVLTRDEQGAVNGGAINWNAVGIGFAVNPLVGLFVLGYQMKQDAAGSNYGCRAN
jgi:hypothetical protein